MSRRRLLRLLSIPLLAYAGFVLLLAGCQAQLIYHPSTASEERLLGLAPNYGLEPWRSPDGSLIGWHTAPPNRPGPSRVVLVFHGNAGQALNRDYFAAGFPALPGDDAWTVYLFEYPGYGARPGKPSERSILPAAREALEYLLARYPDSTLIIVGESLGGGIATQLAAAYPDQVDGLILITPFTRLADVGRYHYPFLPVGLLLRDRYDNVEALRSYHGPVAFLLAENDEVVPLSLGQQLYESYSGPKHQRTEPRQGHNTLPYHPHAPWWREFTEFLIQPR